MNPNRLICEIRDSRPIDGLKRVADFTLSIGNYHTIRQQLDQLALTVIRIAYNDSGVEGIDGRRAEIDVCTVLAGAKC